VARALQARVARRRVAAVLSRRFAAVAIVALLAVALPGLAGCGRLRGAASQAPAVAGSGATSTTATGSYPPAVIPPSNGSPSSESKGGSGAKHAAGLSASDAKSLDAQLSAIQGELDKMSAPQDSDFNSISSGLK